MVVSNFTKKMNFGLLFQKWSLGTQESFCKVWDQSDTQLNNYGLISSDIFDRRGLKESLIGQI